MKNIIVENYLTIHKELIGKQINLSKPNSILLFMEVCRIKQMEIKALQNNFQKNIDNDLIINKSRLENIIDKALIKQNIKIQNLIDDFNNGSYFINKDGEIIEIIEFINFYKNTGEIEVVFNMENFIKYFINIKDNFTKLPLEYFKGIKSKNVTMLLMYIMKYSNVKNVFIPNSDLLFLLNINKNNKLSHLNQSIKRVIEQIKKINLDELKKLNIEKNKNNNFDIKFSSFEINIIMENKKDIIIKKTENKKDENCNFTESELAIYTGGYNDN